MFGKCPHFEPASLCLVHLWHRRCHGTKGSRRGRSLLGFGRLHLAFEWGTEKNIGQFSGASGTPAHLGKFALSFCCMVFKYLLCCGIKLVMAQKLVDVIQWTIYGDGLAY